jgi:hypothetical protein
VFDLCSFISKYVIQDKRRALNADSRTRSQDVRRTSVAGDSVIDDGSRSPSATLDGSTRDNDDVPDWFWKLLAKSRQADSRRTAPARSSQLVPDLPPAEQESTDEDVSEQEDRRARLRELARLLATADHKIRQRNEYGSDDFVGRGSEVQGDSDRSKDANDDAEVEFLTLARLAEIVRTQEDTDTSVRKQLLSKWLNEVRVRKLLISRRTIA